MEIKDELDRQLWIEMNHASDRTAAVTATAFLDDKLSDVITAYLRPDKDTIKRLLKPTGPMGALQNKADLAYLMGLYTEGTRDDIRRIADIRNKFAHWAKPVTFGHKVIREDVEKLGLQKRIFKQDWDMPKPWEQSFAKFVFLSSIDMLCGHLIEMARNPNHPKIVF